jgi:flagellar biosynthesis protein FlhA
MDVGRAIQTYTVLTVGDGLVNEISALLVSVATGILVTRGASDDGLGADLGGQLFARPKLFMVIGGILAAIGFVPGFPTMIFVPAGGMVASVGWLIGDRITKAAAAPELLPLTGAGALATAEPTDKPKLGSGESPLEALRVETLELTVGYGLVGLVDGSAGVGGGLVERIGLIRRQVAAELGLIVPTVRIRDDLALEPDHYVISLRGGEIARAQIDPSRLLAMDPAGGEIALDGIPTTEPVFGMPAAWISVADRELAESMGYTVVDAASVLATHLAETIRAHAHEILGRAETTQLLEALKADVPGLVEEIIPALLSVGEVQKVLAGLLRERIPIRDLSSILDAVADASRQTKEPLFLVEAVRHALARTITGRFRAQDGQIHAAAISPALDARLGQALVVQPGYVGLDLPAHEVRALVESVDKALKRLSGEGRQPVLLCSTRIRLGLRSLLERHAPQLAVLSYEELLPAVPVVVHAHVEAS